MHKAPPKSVLVRTAKTGRTGDAPIFPTAQNTSLRERPFGLQFLKAIFTGTSAEEDTTDHNSHYFLISNTLHSR